MAEGGLGSHVAVESGPVEELAGGGSVASRCQLHPSQRRHLVGVQFILLLLFEVLLGSIPVCFGSTGRFVLGRRGLLGFLHLHVLLGEEGRGLFEAADVFHAGRVLFGLVVQGTVRVGHVVHQVAYADGGRGA